jgi:hypothetical protein
VGSFPGHINGCEAPSGDADLPDVLPPFAAGPEATFTDRSTMFAQRPRGANSEFVYQLVYHQTFGT